MRGGGIVSYEVWCCCDYRRSGRDFGWGAKTFHPVVVQFEQLKRYFHVAVTNQPPMKVFITGNDYLTIIGYRHSLRSLLRLSL